MVVIPTHPQHVQWPDLLCCLSRPLRAVNLPVIISVLASATAGDVSALVHTGGMALRTPIYLDMETLLAHAEYCEIAVPQKEDIVEKITRQGSARATAGVSGIGLGGSVGKDVEYQTSYSLTPRHKAIVSKSIDALITGGHTTSPAPNTVLSKDQLIEVEGISRVTTASMAGKMFHLLLRVLKESSTTVENLDFGALGPKFMEQFKSIYLGNELLPIPILLELSKTPLELKVYLNLTPDHFVGTASADRVEGDVRALGTISKLIGDDEHFSAEQWLLDGYEWMMRRVLMTDIDDQIKKVVESFQVGLPADDVHAWIAGPAIVVDVVALY